MKSTVIREMTTDEVQDALSNERESLAKMRMQHAISPLENPLVLNTKRKIIARLLTELTKRSKEAQQ
ncbi:MAG: 50S ribosomal protein L29 [Salibacteraceae bacterium]